MVNKAYKLDYLQACRERTEDIILSVNDIEQIPAVSRLIENYYNMFISIDPASAHKAWNDRNALIALLVRNRDLLK